MRRLFPSFVVCPVQAFDSGLVRPRGRLQFDPFGLYPDRRNASDAGDGRGLTEIDVDLFDPPLHLRHMASCLEARRNHPELTLRDLGASLGLNRMVIKRALDTARRMDREGRNSAYRELHACPARASRWQHRNDPVSQRAE